MKKVLFGVITAILFLIFSCKKSTTDPKPTTPTIKTDTIVPATVIYGVEVYNQALDTINGTGKKFYNVTSGTYSNSVKSPIELAYVFYQPSNNTTKHILGCAKALKIKALHGVATSNNTSVDFYTINDGNSTVIYDTITNTKTFATLFASKATLSAFEGESSAIASDGFGWDIDEIIGFKLSNGKRGLIKLTTKPTGTKDSNGNISVGKMRFDIKMEK